MRIGAPMPEHRLAAGANVTPSYIPCRQYWAARESIYARGHCRLFSLIKNMIFEFNDCKSWCISISPAMYAIRTLCAYYACVCACVCCVCACDERCVGMRWVGIFFFASRRTVDAMRRKTEKRAQIHRFFWRHQKLKTNKSNNKILCIVTYRSIVKIVVFKSGDGCFFSCIYIPIEIGFGPCAATQNIWICKQICWGRVSTQCVYFCWRRGNNGQVDCCFFFFVFCYFPAKLPHTFQFWYYIYSSYLLIFFLFCLFCKSTVLAHTVLLYFSLSGLAHFLYTSLAHRHTLSVRVCRWWIGLCVYNNIYAVFSPNTVCPALTAYLSTL